MGLSGWVEDEAATLGRYQESLIPTLLMQFIGIFWKFVGYVQIHHDLGEMSFPPDSKERSI